jgi:hypothetical protein
MDFYGSMKDWGYDNLEGDLLDKYENFVDEEYSKYQETNMLEIARAFDAGTIKRNGLGYYKETYLNVKLCAE